MKRVLALVLATIMALSLVACSSGAADNSAATQADAQSATEAAKAEAPAATEAAATEAAVPEVEYKEEVIIGTDTKVNSLDIQENCAIASGYIYLMTHEPLVHYYEGEFFPKLAETWENKDGLEYTFHLRKGIKFHDGSEFSADDVLFTIKRAKENPTTHANVKAFVDTIESVTKVDDYTVVFKLTEVNNDFLIDMSKTGSLGMLSEEACAAAEDGYKYGTGPWVNSEFFAEDHITVVRNDDYWGELPVTKKVTFRLIPEASARLIALENHEIDVCIYPDASEYSLVEENPELDMFTYTSGLNYIFYNVDQAPVDDPNFRLALAYATDNQQIIDGALGGYGVPATTTNSLTAVSFFDDFESVGQSKYTRDLDKAKEYLAKSKYPNGATVTIQFTTGQREIISQILQSQWKDIGVTVELDKTDSAGRAAAKQEDKWQAYLASVAYTDAGNSFSETFVTDGGTNQMGWSNARVDELFKQCAVETDEAKRYEMYKEIQSIIHEECPAYPMYYALKAIAYNKKVSGVKWESRGVMEFAYAKVEK
ncbi:MAG: ABC transporter substrate-binding protein [Lachnospiraceae bacterium]|nr:ABC transporter substrate-binding protein [Lachnospiraceae bacterium]